MGKFFSLICIFLFINSSCTKKRLVEKSLMNTLADGVSYWKIEELKKNDSSFISNFTPLKVSFGSFGFMTFVKEINPSGSEEGILFFSISTNTAGKQLLAITDNPLAPQYLKNCLGEWVVLNYNSSLVTMSGASNNTNSLILRKK